MYSHYRAWWARLIWRTVLCILLWTKYVRCPFSWPPTWLSTCTQRIWQLICRNQKTKMPSSGPSSTQLITRLSPTVYVWLLNRRTRNLSAIVLTVRDDIFRSSDFISCKWVAFVEIALASGFKMWSFELWRLLLDIDVEVNEFAGKNLKKKNISIL